MLELNVSVRSPPTSTLPGLLVGDVVGNAPPLAFSEHGLL